MRKLNSSELKSLRKSIKRYAESFQRICGAPISLDAEGVRLLDEVVDRVLRRRVPEDVFIQPIAAVWSWIAAEMCGGEWRQVEGGALVFLRGDRQLNAHYVLSKRIRDGRQASLSAALEHLRHCRTRQRLFDPGKPADFLLTEGFMSMFDRSVDAAEEATQLLERHTTGDFGEAMGEEGKALNLQQLATGGQFMVSTYIVQGENIYLMTDLRKHKTKAMRESEFEDLVYSPDQERKN